MSGAVFGIPDPKIQCPKAPTCALANYKQDSMGASMGHFYRTTILRNPKKLVCTRWPLHYCDETIPGKSEPCLQTLCKELNLRTRCGEVSGLKVLGLGPISTIVIIIVTTTTIDVTTFVMVIMFICSVLLSFLFVLLLLLLLLMLTVSW